MTHLAHPADRDDGKPWVPWGTTHDLSRILPGHRERVELSAWFDREKQSLVLTLVQYDESMSEWLPCWAQLALIDTGPFFAKAEVESVADTFIDTVIHCWELGSMPE